MKRFGAAMLVVSLGVGFGLAGCATPRQQVATGLQSLGLPSRQATCMADSMDDRLSGDQMRRVAKLVGGANRAGSVEPSRKNLQRAVDIMFDVAEPEIATAASRAFLACTILGG
ncbi:MAG TPA: hypothetical protein VIG90_03880 [Pedomonas sp.]|uniref:hypothetical protein n=1 Tax=Pedomonas sp. TaxID=2976421 RepID=UPI002F4235A8